MDLLVRLPIPRFAMKRSLNNIDMDVFIVDLCIVNERLLSKNFFSLRKLLDKHAPLKKIGIRTKPHPWYDQEVEKICGASQVSILREHCTQLLVIMSISSLTGKILFSIRTSYTTRTINKCLQL